MRVERRDDQAVVLDDGREERLEAFVDAFGRETFSELARDAEQELGDLRLALQFPFGHVAHGTS